MCLRRWERISVRQMMHGMKISHCVWLRCGSQGRCSGRSDSLKQNELMCRWIAWVMTLVVELMKVCVCERERERGRHSVCEKKREGGRKVCV